jgi:hypothetical protein
MSIIHEALKKVQSERSENTKTQNNITPTPKQAPADSIISSAALKTPAAVIKNFWTINKLLWALLLVILLGFTFYNLFAYNVRTTENAIASSAVASIKPPATANIASIHPSTTTVPIARTPMPPQAKKGELILSGVVEMDGKNFALINNEFYETGETVEGARITRITNDSIDILQKNKERTIKILRPREP